MIAGRLRFQHSRTAALAAVLLFAGCKERVPEPAEQRVARVPRGLAVPEYQIPIENARSSSDRWDLEFTVDSLFYLLHAGEPVIRVFSHDGKAVRTIQTAPLTPTSFGWLKDSLWVFDAGRGQVSTFATSGARGRTWIPLPELMRTHNRFAFVALLEDGSALARAEGVSQATRDSIYSSALVRITRSTQVDTFARFESGTIARILVSPLDGMIWMVTEIEPRADSGVIGVIKLKPSGETVFARQFAYKPIPSDSGFLRSVTDAFEAANGSLLIRREEVGTELVLWTVLNRIGVRVAELETPRTAQILVADGTYVYGIARDGQSRPAITRYKIDRD